MLCSQICNLWKAKQPILEITYQVSELRQLLPQAYDKIKHTRWWDRKAVWIDGDTFCAIISLVDANQIISQLEHVVS